ncbi:MAG TPA: DUF4386 domain-containing protein [Gemmatimonadales bacterium]|nr:DUF4386 domain-containing protein [Gemmatimonadales bacterium]
MTRRNNARLAGFAYLFYIAVAFPSMVLMSRATSGEGMAAKLASVAQHATDVHVAAVLSLFSSFCALALAVSLWAITRDQDADLAMLGLTCRVAEGVTGAVSIPASLGLLWLATSAPDPASAQTLAGFVLEDSPLVAASFFALGSTLFSWLLLRGRMIPVPLAWLGVVASILIVVGLPLQLGGLLHGAVTQLMWLPMAAYEIPLGFWLLIKGVAPLEAR